ncbi:unnamed protein product, partial [Thlaspi arvense]
LPLGVRLGRATTRLASSVLPLVSFSILIVIFVNKILNYGLFARVALIRLVPNGQTTVTILHNYLFTCRQKLLLKTIKGLTLYFKLKQDIVHNMFYHITSYPRSLNCTSRSRFGWFSNWVGLAKELMDKTGYLVVLFDLDGKVSNGSHGLCYCSLVGTMRLENCWFCSSTIYPGHGIQFVRNDAKLEQNRTMVRISWPFGRFIILIRIDEEESRKVKWTKAYRRLHGKDMTQDSTFEFERKRNRPERYDRNLTENTLKAIKKIDKVRVDREARHHAQRMKGKRAKEMKEAVKELEQSIHMVKAPAALQQEPSLTLPKIKVKVTQWQQQSEENLMEE